MLACAFLSSSFGTLVNVPQNSQVSSGWGEQKVAKSFGIQLHRRVTTQNFTPIDSEDTKSVLSGKVLLQISNYISLAKKCSSHISWQDKNKCLLLFFILCLDSSLHDLCVALRITVYTTFIYLCRFFCKLSCCVISQFWMKSILFFLQACNSTKQMMSKFMISCLDV